MISETLVVYNHRDNGSFPCSAKPSTSCQLNCGGTPHAHCFLRNVQKFLFIFATRYASHERSMNKNLAPALSACCFQMSRSETPCAMNVTPSLAMPCKQSSHQVPSLSKTMSI